MYGNRENEKLKTALLIAGSKVGSIQRNINLWIHCTAWQNNNQLLNVPLAGEDMISIQPTETELHIIHETTPPWWAKCCDDLQLLCYRGLAGGVLAGALLSRGNALV